MKPQPNNILLNQVSVEGERISFKETFPLLIDCSTSMTLNLVDGSLVWKPVLLPKLEQVIWNPFTYNGNQVGLGRIPLYTYVFDIAVSENKIVTAFHIGDGKRGFSMGNGTSNGFLPEIIGMGQTEEDAGLYIIGRAGNGKTSNIPLIILDGRSSEDSYLQNRPILGITSAKYDSYHLIVDHKGRVGLGKKPEIYKLEVHGEISALDFILNGSSLLDIIKEQQEEIDRMKVQIQQLLNM
jgi:hypothetical protein